MKKLTAIVIGYGARGLRYSEYAIKNPEELEIIGVAEPVEARRNHAAMQHKINENMIFSDWKDIANMPKMADFVIIATQDKMHYEPALAFIEKGYDILLEKPMAPTPEECKEIAEAAEKKGVKVVVCHVLRFTKFWYKLKDIIDNGDIGEVMSVTHTENVGIYHFAHSFTRGNWRNLKESSPMILAKSCHDTDILQWLIGKKCTKVQSFGSLTYFNKNNRPEGAADRCTDDCPHKEDCIFNAVKYYCSLKPNGWRDTVTNKVNSTDEEVIEALKTGPYGRCVYNCDNDVVDHQVVNMEFEGGCTVMFAMHAFGRGGRKINIYGTKGTIETSMSENIIDVYSFKEKSSKLYELDKIGEGIESGHGGGDNGIMKSLMKYFGEGEKNKSICDIKTSYINHLIAFAAEESRLSNKVIDMEVYSQKHGI